jgi:hypothetical protein
MAARAPTWCAQRYTETQRNHVLHGALAAQAAVVGSHERAHARALRRALGSHAARQPRFDFGGATEDPVRFRTHFVVRTTSRRGPHFTG